MGSPKVESGGLSHTGLARQDNQDAFRLPEDHLPAERGRLYAVADGMGGYAHGRLASTLALEKLFAAFYHERRERAPQALRRGVESANLNVFKAAQQLAVGRMGTTLTAACLHGSRLYLAHVGDSRAYLVRGGRAACLTNDHTTVGDLVRMKVLAPEKVRTHAQRSILTRAVGLTLFVRPDITEHTLKEGDCLILCSDGVWSVVEDHEFAELASWTRGARELCQSLIDLALERETDDNISAVAIQVHSLTTTNAENRRA